MNRRTFKKNKLPGRSSKGQSVKARNSTVKKVHQNSYAAVQMNEPSVAKNCTSLKSASQVPASTFQFYVSSDEGIYLYVDLNSHPSDWTNRFTNEFHISEILYRNGSKSLRQDLSCLGESSRQRKNSFLWKTYSTENDHHNGQIKTSPTLKVARDDLARFNQQNEGDHSLISALLMTSNNAVNEAGNSKEDQLTVSAELAANVAEHLEEGQTMVSAEVCYGVPSHFVSRTASCPKDGTKGILDSGVTNTPLIKSLCDSVDNSVSDPGISGHQNSEYDYEIYEEFTRLNNSSIVNRSVGCTASEIGSMNSQISDVASCHKYASVSLGKNDGSPDLIDQKHTSDTRQGRPVNSSELDPITEGNNFPPLTEEWEANKIVNGRESSECTQFDDPHKNSGVDSDDWGSKIELHKKMKLVDSEDKNSSGKRVGKILRSMKHVAEKVQPRRSTRLISKEWLNRYELPFHLSFTNHISPTKMSREN